MIEVSGAFNTLNKIEKALSIQDKCAEHMQALGFNAEFAGAYAKAYNDFGFQTVFRAREITVDYEITSGVKLSVKGMNYVEVRADKDLPGEGKNKSAGAKGPPRPKAGPPPNAKAPT